MMKPKEYLSAVQDAFDRARSNRRSNDLAGKALADAEELAAQLAARGLMIVEAPPGLLVDFRGVPSEQVR